MRLPDVTPTDIEIAILKWVAIPLLLIFFVWLFKVSAKNHQCKKACYAKGYAEYRFQPSGRYNSTLAACYCLTAEEAAGGNKIYKGKQIYVK